MGAIAKTKALRIAFNMLCCAVFFCWASPKPRETISGLFGRKAVEIPFNLKMRIPKFWRAGAKFINALHPSEDDHCFETAILEAHARRCLGYHP